MDLNAFEITLLTGIGTTLTGTVAALWLALNAERKAKDEMRDKMQDKLDTVTRQAIEAINAASNQMNSSSGLLVTIQGLVQKQAEQWQDFKVEILKRVKE